MRTWLFGCVAAMTLVGQTAFAADLRNVTVVNGTGYGIKFLGFNNPGDNDWSDNELGGPLADGGNVYVKFNTADKGCTWNFKIEWADPGYPGVLWEDIDLCEVTQITLKYDRASDATTALTQRIAPSRKKDAPLSQEGGALLCAFVAGPAMIAGSRFSLRHCVHAPRCASVTDIHQ